MIYYVHYFVPKIKIAWLLNGAVQKLVLVVKGVESGDTLERWVFSCETTKTVKDGTNTVEVTSTKSQKEITSEIQAIIRQITASVTFLPLLQEACSFDLLVYADKEATVPVTWEDSDPCFIANAEDVKLRSFTTKVTRIVYKDVLHRLPVLLSSYNGIDS